ncbi:MAG: hypothetical protein WD468_09095 [Pirellulales bacterium]
MKRRTSQEFDSLELLLDTICNTFGGVLFLAVLIIALVHRTGGTLARAVTGDADSATATTLKADLEQREAELQSLERALQEYRTTLAELEAEQAVAQARDVLRLRNNVTDLISRRAQYVNQFARLSQEVTEFEQMQESRDSVIIQERKTVQSLVDQLESVRKSQSRTTNLPMLRQTAKREFPIIVRFGRLYFPFTADTALTNRKSNLNDFVILDEEETVIRAIPKPYAGLSISGNDAFLDSLRDQLLPVDSETVYLAIGVWEDSFEEFQDLKAAIVKLGFEYRLLPVGTGDFIQESTVRKTLVQ